VNAFTKIQGALPKGSGGVTEYKSSRLLLITIDR
jgi:hypothetical protein